MPWVTDYIARNGPKDHYSQALVTWWGAHDAAAIVARPDDYYSEAQMHARHMARVPAAAAHEAAVTAWWDAHTAWCNDGCPEDRNPGPHPDEPQLVAEAEAQEEVSAKAMGGWQPVNLTSHADGTHEPEPATILERSDGAGLLYPGKVHAFNGEPESGKSMLAQWAVALELTWGFKVLVLDYESDAATYVERLMAMGVSRTAITQRLTYLNPEVDPTKNPAALAAMDALLASKSFSLAILDGVTEALALAGADTNSGDDYTLWHKMVPRRIAKAGAAVVVVDHVTKSSDSRGRFAIGSQAKLATLTGAAYLVDVKRPLGRGVIGELSLKVAKDRPGYVRGMAGKWSAGTRLQEAARILVDGTMLGRIAIVVNPPRDDHDDDGDWRPTGLMEKTSKTLEDAGEALGFNELAKRVGGKREHVQAAVAALVKEGHITTASGPRSSILHTSASPYRQADEADRADATREAGNQSEAQSESSGTATGPRLSDGEPGTSQRPVPGTGGESVGNREPVTPSPAGGLGWQPPTSPAQVPGAGVRA